MLPISAREPVRFTPPGAEGDPAPVYLIEVPTYLTRPMVIRRLADYGAYLPDEDKVRAELEAGIREAVSEHQQAELLAVVDAYHQAEAEDRLNVPEDVGRAYQDVVAQLLPVLPMLRKLAADRAFYYQMLPIVTCECFLKGVENVPVDFRLAGGMVSRRTMEALDPGHVALVGWKAIALTSLTREQEKNSASPSRSPSAPGTTPAAPSPRTAETGGNSSETSTPPTPGSD